MYDTQWENLQRAIQEPLLTVIANSNITDPMTDPTWHEWNIVGSFVFCTLFVVYANCLVVWGYNLSCR